MITYYYPEGKIGDRNTSITVKLDGKKVGMINPVDGGWQYSAMKSKSGGKVYPTIKEVQKSLESDDDE
jgi:hypothetical protein